jgi:hypothetical protein
MSINSAQENDTQTFDINLLVFGIGSGTYTVKEKTLNKLFKIIRTERIEK